MVVIPKYHSGHPANFSQSIEDLSFPEICFTWCVMLGVFEVGQAMTIFFRSSWTSTVPKAKKNSTQLLGKVFQDLAIAPSNVQR